MLRLVLAVCLFFTDTAPTEIYPLSLTDALPTSGQTPAEGLLEAFHGYWNGDIDALFTDCMY